MLFMPGSAPAGTAHLAVLATLTSEEALAAGRALWGHCQVGFRVTSQCVWCWKREPGPSTQAQPPQGNACSCPCPAPADWVVVGGASPQHGGDTGFSRPVPGPGLGWEA